MADTLAPAGPGWLDALHALPHYSFRFHVLPTDSDGNFDLTSLDYLTTLQVVACTGAALACAYIIALMFVACCRCQAKRRNGVSAGRVVLVLLFLGAAAGAAYCAVEADRLLRDGADNVDAESAAYGAADAALTGIGALYDATVAAAVRAQLTQAGAPAEYINDIDTITNNVGIVVDVASSVGVEAPSLDSTGTTSIVRAAARWALIGVGIFVGLAAVLGMLPPARPAARWAAIFLGGIFMVVACGAAGGSLASLTLLADACHNATGQVMVVVGSDDLMLYYLTCRGDSPFADEYASARGAMHTASASMAQVGAYMRGRGLDMTQANILTSDVAAVANTINWTYDVMHCEQFSARYGDTVSTTCQSFSIYWLCLVCLAFFLSALLFVVVLAATVQDRRRRRHDSSDEESSERTPLLERPPPGRPFSVTDEAMPAADAMCKICLARPISVLYQPCSHATCDDCSRKLPSACPFCRRPVMQKIPMYL